VDWTGGVGMGKSTTAGFFAPAAHRSWTPTNSPASSSSPASRRSRRFKLNLGKDLVAADGQLRRDELARIVFWPMPPPAKNSKPSSTRASANAGSRNSRPGAEKTARWPSSSFPLPVRDAGRIAVRQNHLRRLPAAAQHERLLARGWTPETNPTTHRRTVAGGAKN